MSNDIISVIVPVYSVEKYLSLCLRSICEQSHSNIEIICIYKESKDHTVDILYEYQKKDSRIQILKLNSGGLGGARNYGLAYATGEYISFIDSDDWIHKSMLLNLYAKAKKENADISMCAVRSYDDNKAKFVKNSWIGYDLPFTNDFEKRPFTFLNIAPQEFISGKAPVTAWNKIYRKTFLMQNRILFPEDLAYEDNPFYYEAMIKAQRVVCTKKKYYNHRVERVGSLQYERKHYFDIIPIMKNIFSMLTLNNVEIPFMDAFYSYASNELLWRYNLLNSSSKEAFTDQVKLIFPSAIYNKFF